MKQVRVDGLVPGSKLPAALYDSRKNLVLEKGARLSASMITRLIVAGSKFVFLDEVSLTEVKPKTERPLESMRAEIDRKFITLTHRFENELSRIDFDVSPEPPSFESTIDRGLRRERTEEAAEKLASLGTFAASVIDGISSGKIDFEHAGEAAENVAQNLVKAFAEDPDYVLGLVHQPLGAEDASRHAFNSSVLAMAIASAMGYGEQQLHVICIAALLHDIGMDMIPRELIESPRRLTRAELLGIQKHSAYGFYAISQMRGIPYLVRFIVYQVHERADGSGYPTKRRKPLIHPFAQILGMADVYGALVAPRPWRRAYHPHRAIEHVVREAAAGRFDLAIARALLGYLSLYPVGCFVTLSTGVVGEVVHANFDETDRPAVRVLRDADGARVETAEYIDLAEEADIEIVSLAAAEPLDNAPLDEVSESESLV